MNILSAAVLTAALLFGPWLVSAAAKRIKLFGLLGPVFLCYALGLGGGAAFRAFGWDTSLGMTIAEVMVPLAVPLILFSADLASVKRLARPMLTSFLLVCASVFAVSCGVFFLLGGTVAQPAELSGMLIGLYTGGTPNLLAIGAALDMDSDTVALANAADVVVGGLYFLLLIAVGPAIARRAGRTDGGSDAVGVIVPDAMSEYAGGGEQGSIRRLLGRIPAVLLAAACLAAGAGISILTTGELTNVVVIMLAVTTLGIALSFVPAVRRMKTAYSSGQYFIYIFSVGIGFSFDLSAFDASALRLLGYIALVQFGSAALHYILAAVCRVGASTAVITSVAGIFGPAFIVPVANAMKDHESIISGLICGILGYAVGNYLGIGTAMLLRLFC